MSQLADTLDTVRDLIGRSLAERLADMGCTTIVRTAAGNADALVYAFLAVCRAENADVARQWASQIYQQGLNVDLSWSEVLSALHCLQRAVRFQVLRMISAKKALVGALSESSAAVEQMRQAYFVAVFRDGAKSADGEDLAALVDELPYAVLVASPHGRPTFLNRAARRLIGLPEPDPVPDLSLHHYYAEDSWRRLRDEVVPAVNDVGFWEGRCRLRHLQTGELMEMVTTMFILRRGGGERGTRLVAIHRDAAPLQRLEQTLAEIKARKRAILESSLDPIITINHEGRITEFNRAAEQTFGYPRDQVLGTKPSEVLFPPTLGPDQKERIDRYLAAGEGSMLGKRAEVIALRADGDTFPAELAMTISQEGGEPVLTFFIRDISLQKQIEAEKARHAAELERSNYDLQQFAYVASHDLQEPLRKIRMFGDRLEAKCKDQLDDTGRECVERMQGAALRMQGLIDGLLTLSRVATGAQDFVPVDLAAIAAEVVSDLETQIERVGGRVEIGKLPTIQADPLQMRQLLQNLIANAMKFHRPEEPPLVRLSGRYAHSRADRPAGGRPSDESVRLLVEDNGIGFDEKHADRIFGVFQRLHPRETYEGTGIGLAICRRIVERHGGTIAAHSTPGVGSTFEIVLPVVQPRSRKTVVE